MSSTSYGRRLKRVEAKLEAAERVAADWLDSGWEALSVIDGRERVRMVRQIRPLDPEFEHLIYEIAEGLLATLDLLAFAVSEKNCPGWTAKQQVASAFPIYEKELNSRTRRSYEAKIQCWPEDALQVLNDVQPHKYLPRPQQSPLWLLHDLANRGKHRTIAVVQSGMSASNTIFGNGTTHSLKVAGPVDVISDEPQEYMRVSLANNAPVRTTIVVKIKFGTGPLLAGFEVMDSLNTLHDYVKYAVVKSLIPFTVTADVEASR